MAKNPKNNNPNGIGWQRGGKKAEFWAKGHIPPSDLAHVEQAQKAYWTKKCSLCGSKALYRAGGKAFCKAHKQVASEWWSAHPMRINFRLINDYVMED